MVFAVTPQIARTGRTIPSQLPVAVVHHVERKIHQSRTGRISPRIRSLTVNAKMTFRANGIALSRAGGVNVCSPIPLVWDLAHMQTVVTKVGIGTRVPAGVPEWRFGVALQTQREICRRVRLSARFEHPIAIIVHQITARRVCVRREARASGWGRCRRCQPIVAVTMHTPHHPTRRERPQFIRRCAG